MNQAYMKVMERLSYLLQTEDPENELSLMAELQREMQPHLSEQVSFDLVVLGIIKTYEDHDLDYWWTEYIHMREQANMKKTA